MARKPKKVRRKKTPPRKPPPLLKLSDVVPVAPVKPKHPGGAPSKYSLEVVTRICDFLAAGKALSAIGEMEDMPGRSTILRWLDEHEEFRDLYARARSAQADFYAEEILKISDTPVEGIKTKDGPHGMEITTGDMIEHRRLQVDARKWFASKLAPKKYGDKQINEHSGPDGTPIPIQPVINLYGKP